MTLHTAVVADGSSGIRLFLYRVPPGPIARVEKLLATAGMPYAKGVQARPVIDRLDETSCASSGSKVSHLSQCNSPDSATVDATAPPQVVPHLHAPCTEAMHSPPRRNRHIIGLAVALVSVLGVVATGCMGGLAVRSTRLAYNQSYSLTNDQEILLNIVRLRYGESPNFMDLPAITSQIEAASDGTGGSTTTPGLGVWGGLFKLRDAPTLSYTPRTGYNVSSTLFKTLGAETLLDISPGGNTEIFFLAFVDSINGVGNAQLATSPLGKVLDSNMTYRYGIENFLELQRRGGIGLRLATIKHKSFDPIKVTMMSGMDLVNAAEKDYTLQDDGDRVQVVHKDTVLAAVINPAELDSSEVAEITNTFKLRPGRTVYRVLSMEKNKIDLTRIDERDAMPATVLTEDGVEILPLPSPALDPPATTDDPDNRANETYESETEIEINVRSGYQIMSFLAKGVDVPEKHLASGVAPSFCGQDGRPFDPRQLTKGFFRVCVQKHRPWHTTLAVHYRGHWFYVAEDDAMSRAVVNMLEMILGLQLQEKSQGPVLTLPIN